MITQEEERLRIARKWAHLSIIVPFWGLLFAFMLYGFVSRVSPSDKRNLSQAIAWQMLFNGLHLLCWGVILGSLFLSGEKWTGIAAYIGAGAFVLWFLLFFLGVFVALVAAKSAERSEDFRYPLVSGIGHERKH